MTDAPIRVTVTVATVILADRQYSSEDEAGQWLERVSNKVVNARLLEQSRGPRALADGPFPSGSR